MSPSDGTSRRHFLVGAAGVVGGGIVSGTVRDLLLACGRRRAEAGDQAP